MVCKVPTRELIADRLKMEVSSVACKEIALSTIEFRRTETTKEMRKEKRDDQCGSHKRHEEVDAVNEQKKATTACIELKRTCKDHQQKA